MINYLLSIDPSIKNTGFTLWEKTEYHQRCIGDCIKYGMICECEISNNHYEWKPIWIKSFNFQKDNDFYLEVKSKVHDLIEITRKNSNFKIIIERGTFHSKNGIGYETQEHLRGFIAGQFNKLLTKNMLISPKKWQMWVLKNYSHVINIDEKYHKEKSIILVKWLIEQNNWNIKINNHDEADSLLIGWYYLNKENK